jgi:hypothetical protein
MYISLANHIRDLQGWPVAHRPGNDDDDSGGATPIAVAEPPTDDRDAMEESPHRPWLVPGVGCSL